MLEQEAVSRQDLRLMPVQHRPRYHYTPEPDEWSSLASADGLIFWKGRYHVFYQHSRHGVLHRAPMEWGHAISDDLLHWTQLPVALTPTPGGADEAGCFSGCTVDNDGVPTIIYTGVVRLDPTVDFEWRGKKFKNFWAGHRQCIATSNDDLLTWEKHPDNPVLEKGSETGLNLAPHWHDPVVWREADTWYMLIGGGIEGSGEAYLLYTSSDLVRWNYLHPLFTSTTEHHSSAPDYFPLDRRHVLLEARGLVYHVGTCEEHRFKPEVRGRTDLAVGVVNAPKTFRDGRGRRIMMAGIFENRDEAAQRNAGWAGVLSLPKLLSVRDDGTLGMTPVPELKTLRSGKRVFRDLALNPDLAPFLDEVQGDCLDIEADFEPGDASEFGLRVRSSPDGVEETLICYRRGENRLCVNRERSSLDPGVRLDEHGGEFELAGGEPLKLRIFLDRSVIEIFANGRTCLTSRIYPSREDSLGIGLFASGGTAKLNAMNIWDMESITLPSNTSKT